MPIFDTPEPICLTVDLGVGDLKVTATDRIDTVVDVCPSDSSRKSDIKAAEHSRIDYANGRLWVKAQDGRHTLHDLIRRAGSVDVKIEMPSGSHVRVSAVSAPFRGEGRFGECSIKSGAGDIRLDRTGSLHLNASGGDVTVGRADGTILVDVGHGAVRFHEIHGVAVIKTSNGDSWVGVVTGDLRLRAANGSVSVGRSHAAVEAKVANGNIRVAEVVCGSAVLETGAGRVEIGIREGTTARLDVRTRYGNVNNTLVAADAPEASEKVGDVRARTSYGDIVICRS